MPKQRLRFPADGLVLDACTLMRLFNCGALDRIKSLATLHVAMHVHAEFARGGRAQKKALAALGVVKHAVVPGSEEWNALCLARGGAYSTTGLGEDQSIAVCVAQARRGRILPLVTFDKGAGRKATKFGVATVDFLSLLAWLVGCECMTVDEANALEVLAGKRNGWKRPNGYSGTLEQHADHLRNAIGPSIHKWRVRAKRGLR